MIRARQAADPEPGEAPVASMRTERVGQTMIVVHAAREIDSGEWSAYCQLFKDVRPAGALIFAPPGCPGPNADQRRQTADMLRASGNPPLAVLTHSAFHRHLITALNWLSGGNSRAFYPREIDDACAHARISATSRSQVLGAAARLAREQRVEQEFREVW
jgi:hypothetical protein